MASLSEQNALQLLFSNVVRHRGDGMWMEPGVMNMQALFQQVMQREVSEETIITSLQKCGFSANQNFAFTDMLALLHYLRQRLDGAATQGNSMLLILDPSAMQSFVPFANQDFYLCRVNTNNGTFEFQLPYYAPGCRDGYQEGTMWLEMYNLPRGRVDQDALRFKSLAIPGQADMCRLALSGTTEVPPVPMYLACHGHHCGGKMGSDAYYVHTHHHANNGSLWKLTKSKHEVFYNLDVYKVESTFFPDHFLTVGTFHSSAQLRRPSDFKEGSLMLWTKSSVQAFGTMTQQAAEGFQWLLVPADDLAHM